MPSHPHREGAACAIQLPNVLVMDLLAVGRANLGMHGHNDVGYVLESSALPMSGTHIISRHSD